MKTITQTFLILASLLFTLHIYAQESRNQFGIRAGVNMATIKMTNSTDKVKNSQIGLNIGLTFDRHLYDKLYLLTALEFLGKGADMPFGYKTNLYYLQLPVHAGYKFSIAKDLQLIFHAGPYIAYGLDGELTNTGDDTVIDMFESSNDMRLLKRFDFGLGVGIGIEYRKFIINVGYDFGVTNISDDFGKNLSEIPGPDIKIKNRNGYLTLGYKF